MKIEFNKENFSRFLTNFDPIYKKYFFMFSKNDYEQFINQNYQYYYKCVDNIYNCVSSKNVFNKWNVDVQCQIYDVINTVYFHSHDIHDSVLADEEIVGIVFEKFIYDYLNISGISELFNPEFFKLEKMMHEEYRNNQKPYYRDHYIHQTRNMYEMFTFLDDIGIIDKCIEHQFNQEKEIGEYLNIAIKEEMRNLNPHEMVMFNNVYNLICKSHNKDYPSIEDYQMDFFKHYIIYGTAIVSSLLHDIGYPMEFLGRLEEIYENFIPTSKVFFDVKDDFVYINNVLKESLLFQSVPNDEIKDRVLKHNHGTMSAIIILMYYYQNNIMHNLSPVEKAIIELSAFVIYNHTVNYSFQTLKSGQLYKNIFVKGPLSYLFRLCDDIQEWDRTYYEITDKGNIFICPKCKRPLLSQKFDGTSTDNVSNYFCACAGTNIQETNIAGIRLGNFKYRRIMNAIACNHVYITYKDKEPVSNEYEVMNIDIDYGLDNLLQLAFYNINYAHYRQFELESLRRSLMTEADFPYGYVNGVATYNPIYIKCEILNKYEKLHIKNENGNKLKTILYNPKLTIEEVDEYISELCRNFQVFIYDANTPEKILKILFKNEDVENINLLQNQLNFYICLMNIGYYFEEAALKYNISDEKTIEIIDEIVKTLFNNFNIQTAQVDELIKDYLYHKINYVSFENYCFYLNKSKNKEDYQRMRCLYEKMGKSKNSEILQNKVLAYTDFRLPNNDYYKFIHKEKNSGLLLDFFSDYYVFYLLAKQRKDIKDMTLNSKTCILSDDSEKEIVKS